jgi:hypothetical protein
MIGSPSITVIVPVPFITGDFLLCKIVCSDVLAVTSKIPFVLILCPFGVAIGSGISLESANKTNQKIKQIKTTQSKTTGTK